jgi:hypothetical protein
MTGIAPANLRGVSIHPWMRFPIHLFGNRSATATFPATKTLLGCPWLIGKAAAFTGPGFGLHSLCLCSGNLSLPVSLFQILIKTFGAILGSTNLAAKLGMTFG